MFIETCHLTAFGKFSNYSIDFTRGFNIIKGPNEAGKSTIHKFIEGMFFGFLDIGKTRKVYLPEYDYYKPHNKNEYFGSMVINYENHRYLIERNFLKNNQSVVVTNLDTNENITDRLELDPGTKLPDLSRFLNINYSLFTNTVSISQMNNRTSSSLPQFLVEKLSNLQSTKDEFISLTNITKHIDDKIDKIGTKKAPTKPLAKTISKQLELTEELQNSKTELERMNELIIEHHSLETNISSLIEQQKNIKHQIDVYENQQRFHTYEKAKDIQTQIDTITEQQKPLMAYQHIKEEQYQQAKEYTQKMESLQLRINDFDQELKHQSIDVDLESFKADVKQAVDIYPLTKDKKTKHGWFLISSILLLIGMVPSSIFIPNLIVRIVVPLLLLLGAFILYKMHQNLLKQVTQEMTYNAQLKKTYMKYNVEDNFELNELYHLVMDASRQRETWSEKITELQTELQSIKTEYTNILTASNTTDLDSLKIAVDKHKSYLDLQMKITNLSDRLQDITNGVSIKDLKEKINFDIIDQDEIDNSLELKEQLNEIQQKLLEYNKENTNILSTIHFIEDHNRDVRLIEQELAQVSQEKQSLEASLASLELARSVLMELGEEIRYEFAPQLNQEISTIIKRITSNKYSDIRLDKDIDIKIFDSQTNQLMGIETYSMGTIDQIYLAMRFGIINLISQQSISFILDDAFVNYDQSRLDNVLEILSIEQKNRQILLFTCHKREIERLRQKQIDVTLIEIEKETTR